MRVSFWLIPSEPARSELDALIRDLARRFDAPVFAPHVTIYSGKVDEFTNPNDILDAVLTGAKPLELNSAGVSFTAQFTKTLFIQLQHHAQLSLLSETIRMSTSAREAYDLQPHLSLLYASIDEPLQRELARSIKPPARIRYDKVQVVHTGDSNRTRADVERWRILATAALS